MREILFRGKRMDNEKWVYGNLIQRNILGAVFPIIRAEDKGYGNFKEWEVIPETVGQYTGVEDKNGKEIFEGDILDCGDRIARVERNRPNGCWDSVFIKYKGELCSNGIEPVEWKYRATVIGNATDNPELMEKWYD